MDRKICVKGLRWNTRKGSLRTYFSQFGEVLEEQIVIDEGTGGCKGFGFVKFADPSIVGLVLGQHTIDDKRVEVMRKEPHMELRGRSYIGKKIFVSRIPYSMTEEQLGEYFGRYGEVTKASITFKCQLDPPRGKGFVSFASENGVIEVFEDLSTSRTLNNTNLRVALFHPSSSGGPRGRRGNRRRRQQAASASHHAQLQQSDNILDQDHVQMDGHGHGHGHGHGLIVPLQTNVGRYYPPPPSSNYVTPPSYEYGAVYNSGVVGGGYGEGYAGDVMINYPNFIGFDALGNPVAAYYRPNIVPVALPIAAYSRPNIVPADIPTYYYEYPTTQYHYHEQQQQPMLMVMINRPIGQPVPEPVPVVISTSNRNNSGGGTSTNRNQQGGGTGGSSSSSINLEEATVGDADEARRRDSNSEGAADHQGRNICW